MVLLFGQPTCKHITVSCAQIDFGFSLEQRRPSVRRKGRVWWQEGNVLLHLKQYGGDIVAALFGRDKKWAIAKFVQRIGRDAFCLISRAIPPAEVSHPRPGDMKGSSH